MIEIMKSFIIIVFVFMAVQSAMAQSVSAIPRDTLRKRVVDTTIVFKEVSNFVFKNPRDGQEYARDIDYIRTVLPYVRIAKRVYREVQEQKVADTKNNTATIARTSKRKCVKLLRSRSRT